MQCRAVPQRREDGNIPYRSQTNRSGQIQELCSGSGARLEIPAFPGAGGTKQWPAGPAGLQPTLAACLESVY